MFSSNTDPEDKAIAQCRRGVRRLRLGRVSQGEKGKDGERQDSLSVPFYLLFASFILSIFSFPFHPSPPSSSSFLLLPHHHPCPIPPSAICSIPPASPADEQELPVPGCMWSSHSFPGWECRAASGPSTCSSSPKAAPRCPDSSCLQAVQRAG